MPSLPSGLTRSRGDNTVLAIGGDRLELPSSNNVLVLSRVGSSTRDCQNDCFCLMKQQPLLVLKTERLEFGERRDGREREIVRNQCAKSQKDGNIGTKGCSPRLIICFLHMLIPPLKAKIIRHLIPPPSPPFYCQLWSVMLLSGCETSQQHARQCQGQRPQRTRRYIFFTF